MSLRAPAVLLLAAALLAAGCGRHDDGVLAACRLPPGATVLAIGDSLTRGFGADGGEGYAEQLQRRLGTRAVVVNRGIDGERSEGLLARLEAELAEHRPAAVLITSGGNDFLRRDDAHTLANLRQAVQRVRASGATPLLFAIPQPGLGAVIGRLAAHPLYQTLQEEGGAHVIEDVVTQVLSDAALKSDQIHPNRAGYARMAEAAEAALRRCR